MKEANEINEWRHETNKVVKRRGQNEHLKQGDEQKQVYILQLTWIHERSY